MKKKIKVAWFTDDIDRQGKGAATYTQKLLEQLATNFKDQIDLTLVHRAGKCIHPVCGLTKNITIKTFKTKYFSGILSWAWFFLTNKEKFDIFHVPRHNLYPFFFLAKWRGKFKKVFCTLHGAPRKDTPKIIRKGGFWWDLHIKYFAKYLVDMFLAGAKQGQKQIIEYYNINPKKTDYFYISCNNQFHQLSIEEKKQAKIKLKEKYGIQPPYFLQVGRLDPHKNVHRLIEAFAIIKKKYQIPHKLIVVGGRHLINYSNKVDQTIKENNLENSVIIASFIDNQDMPALYNLCDLFTYVCLNDGFSIPLVEAMKTGAPIVTSNMSVFPEVAGEAGYYVNPFNPEDIAQGIWKMLNDGKLRNDLVQKGLKRGAIFSWESAGQDLVNIYKKLLS